MSHTALVKAKTQLTVYSIRQLVTISLNVTTENGYRGIKRLDDVGRSTYPGDRPGLAPGNRLEFEKEWGAKPSVGLRRIGRSLTNVIVHPDRVHPDWVHPDWVHPDWEAVQNRVAGKRANE